MDKATGMVREMLQGGAGEGMSAPTTYEGIELADIARYFRGRSAREPRGSPASIAWKEAAEVAEDACCRVKGDTDWPKVVDKVERLVVESAIAWFQNDDLGDDEAEHLINQLSEAVTALLASRRKALEKQGEAG